jgi:hypothetical protein
MLSLINRPVILSISLLSWLEVAMSFIIHLSYLSLFLLVPAIWIEYILCIFTANCGYTKGKSLILLDLVRPVIVSLVAHAKRLLQLGSVLALLNLVELVSKTSKVLSLDHLVHML